MTEPALFDLPPEVPPDLEAVAILTHSVEELRAAVADLAGQHAALARRVAARRGAGPAGVPGLRWRDLDRVAASHLWSWLINWADWFVNRYCLQEEIPPCWAQHPALVEELTGLCAAWHEATDAEAAPGDLTRWHESLSRFLARMRHWDDQTQCRHGAHRERRLDLKWPVDWRGRALDAAEADVADRPAPTIPIPVDSVPVAAETSGGTPS